MATMNEAEQELYQSIYAMTIPDVQNELERYNLLTTGTKTACCQRLYKYKRQFLSQREYKSKTPVVSRITTRSQTRNQAKLTSTKEPESMENITTQIISHPEQRTDYVSQEEPESLLKKVDVDVKSTLEDFEHKIEQNLERKFETYMAQMDEKISQMLTYKQRDVDLEKAQAEITYKATENFPNTSTPVSSKTKGIEITQLLRKQKFFYTTITVVCEEIFHLHRQENSCKEIEKALQRLNSLERDYSSIIQNLVEKVTDEELQKWAVLQQRILQVSSLAEKYISTHSDMESEKHRSPSCNDPPISVAGKLRLPKFTLPDFTGNILHWVSWWDQYKTCIHENKTLTDRDRFNYRRMYLKGTAKRAIEFIEVSSDNYSKAIDALQKRFGRKRLVVEHLVDST